MNKLLVAFAAFKGHAGHASTECDRSVLQDGLRSDFVHSGFDGFQSRFVTYSHVHLTVGIIRDDVGALTTTDDTDTERCAGDGAVEGLHLLYLVGKFEDGVTPLLWLDSRVGRNSSHFDAILT